MPFQPLTIDTDDLTLDQLDDFVCQARGSGAIGDNPVLIDAVDDNGKVINPRTITIEVDY